MGVMGVRNTVVWAVTAGVMALAALLIPTLPVAASESAPAQFAQHANPANPASPASPANQANLVNVEQAISSAISLDPARADANTQAVADRLKSRYPNLEVVAVSRLPLGESVLYEFLASGLVGYTNETVDFVLMGGELIAGVSPNVRNVTKERAAAAAARVVQGLPFDRALVYRLGRAERRLALFSDPDCPYCRDLERTLVANADQVNALVYVFPYPLTSLHPKAENRARVMLCADDPEGAWRTWMTQGTGSDSEWSALLEQMGNPRPDCDRAALLDSTIAIGRVLGFNTTPTLIFDNGMTWSGMLSLDELDRSFEYAIANPTAALQTPEPQLVR